MLERLAVDRVGLAEPFFAFSCNCLSGRSQRVPLRELNSYLVSRKSDAPQGDAPSRELVPAFAVVLTPL